MRWAALRSTCGQAFGGRWAAAPIVRQGGCPAPQIRRGGREDFEQSNVWLWSRSFAGTAREQPLGKEPSPPCANPAQMLALSRWVVFGRGTNRIVRELLDHLAAKGRTVHHVDPKGESGPAVPRSVADLPEGIHVDVLNLCANPSLGLQAVADGEARGIGNVFIQPGAASADIEEKCRGAKITVRRGCVLQDM